MDRRNFFRVVGTASGGAVTGACGRRAEEIIPLLVPEEGITPGVETWHPGVCAECGAGCGITARVMASEREIEVDGERVRQRIAAIKKLEGNRDDPISGGRLCARGHAALQSLYNPDRLRGPMRRVGARGEGRFEPVSWNAAMDEAADRLRGALEADASRVLFLARPRMDLRTANISRFLTALGAPPACATGTGDFAPEKEGARRAFGWDSMPAYDLRDAMTVLSIGADFLGGWVSPVLYARQYAHFRNGRRGLRGRLIHAESRYSLTAWNADRWLPVWPGEELALALGIGKALVDQGQVRSGERATEVVARQFAAVDIERAATGAGIGVDVIREIASELAESTAPVVVAGASMVRENSGDAVAAASALNLLLGRAPDSGAVVPTPNPLPEAVIPRPTSARWRDRLADASVVLVDGTNPAYGCPSSRDSLRGADTVISLSSFLDDTSAFADLILPDDDPLERAALSVPPTSPVLSVACNAAFVAPLHDTRPAEQVLSELAEAVGTPYETLDLDAALTLVHAATSSSSREDSPDEFVAETLERGGWQGERAPIGPPADPDLGDLEIAPSAQPIVFQAYESVQFGEGGGANRPWLQELPDPTSSAMWDLPVEIDPATAEELGVTNGDTVRVHSRHGSLEAPVYVHPAAIPGVVSMGLGQGHSSFGRYASWRGANPMRVIGDFRDAKTGTTAMGPTPVRLEKVRGTNRLIQFSRQDRDEPQHRI